MHPNPVFHSDDQATGIAFVRQRGFGVLSVQGPEGIVASHIPFVTETTHLDAHAPRSNAIARLLRKDGPMEALMIVSGPDGYISPDWYWVEDQVPTWNYVAVHLRGEIALRDAETLPGHLDQLSAVFEDRLKPKKPWTMGKMTDGVAEKMMQMLVPLRFTIRTIEQTWKLNQNKSETARMGAAAGLEATGFGHEVGALAAHMRDWVKE